ncbi:hypothetical protein A6A04_19735 [Paramagnetospirillum marisnigri]|uniref:Uncharacterized protein n=1 Tax=Paramagnetospirillum marisnigri TaxID=1285242 RepID=A0A178MJC2_9PROT|nr:hypothetical protein [Paramagnetospirillum marisnigri]OAN48832.1 hypothetical protein A6A04_19735 [Paramagnetospirillum marisnigri]
MDPVFGYALLQSAGEKRTGVAQGGQDGLRLGPVGDIEVSLLIGEGEVRTSRSLPITRREFHDQVVGEDEVVVGLLPENVRPVLMGDRFYGSLLVFEDGGETTLSTYAATAQGKGCG